MEPGPTAVIVLRGCQITDNQNNAFEAFGARSTGSIAGTTNNKVTISIKQGTVEPVRTDSQPSEATVTNTVTVIHS